MREKDFAFPRREKLKSKTLIRRIFEAGESFSHFPFRVLYMRVEENTFHLQVAFSVSTKYFKTAVDRNRIRRLMREAYRLQKHRLIAGLEEKQVHYVIFFIYTGNQLPNFEDVRTGIGGILKRVLEKAIE